MQAFGSENGACSCEFAENWISVRGFVSEDLEFLTGFEMLL
jgi:hypothetical protein